jgi:histidyl-tRNA synthetase
MSNKLQTVRGTHDLLPEIYAQHQHIIATAQQVAARYGFAGMQTPIFEFSDVFHRTLGDSSDVVSKETYRFEDRGGESLTLRPEFTASIARAFISNSMQQQVPCRWFYHGPAFRYERPQKGRQRQFHQFGCELLGAPEWQGDVDIIALGHDILNALGLGDAVRIEINTLGDSESRKTYRDQLVSYLQDHTGDLSDDSKIRLGKNPLRVLDSKAPQDQAIVKNAPSMGEAMNAESRDFFAQVQAGLKAMGIAFSVNETLVRGLDYYNHTVFEFITDHLGAQGTVLSGGRYDGLVGMIGGAPTAGVGFAAGIERLVLLRETLKLPMAATLNTDIAVIVLDDTLTHKALNIAHTLRKEGFNTDMAYKGNAGKRFKRADKLGARLAVILGSDEDAREEVTLKNLTSGTQKTLRYDDLLTEIPNALQAL